MRRRAVPACRGVQGDPSVEESHHTLSTTAIKSAPALPCAIQAGIGSLPTRFGRGCAPDALRRARGNRGRWPGPHFERRHDVGCAERNAPISPVLTVVLPLPEAGAAITTAGTAVIGHLPRLPLDAPSDLSPGIHRVFDLHHLGDEVSGVDQLRRCPPSGDDYMLAARPLRAPRRPRRRRSSPNPADR